jgi:hypothetical protein
MSNSDLAIFPNWFISVQAGNLKLACEVLCGSGKAKTFYYSDELPEKVRRDMEDDVKHASENFSRSGSYPLLSQSLWRFIERPTVKDWVETSVRNASREDVAA